MCTVKGQLCGLLEQDIVGATIQKGSGLVATHEGVYKIWG